jgi:hypothetical protein
MILYYKEIVVSLAILLLQVIFSAEFEGNHGAITTESQIKIQSLVDCFKKIYPFISSAGCRAVKG